MEKNNEENFGRRTERKTQKGSCIKTYSSIIGHVSSSPALDIYLHSTDKMQKEAARSIDRGIRGVSSKEKTSEGLNTDGEKSQGKPKFEPTKSKYRKPGTDVSARLKITYGKADIHRKLTANAWRETCTLTPKESAKRSSRR